MAIRKYLSHALINIAKDCRKTLELKIDQDFEGKDSVHVIQSVKRTMRGFTHIIIVRLRIVNRPHITLNPVDPNLKKLVDLRHAVSAAIRRIYDIDYKRTPDILIL